MAYVNFNDAANNAGCHSYADVINSAAQQLMAQGMQVLVFSQPMTATSSAKLMGAESAVILHHKSAQILVIHLPDSAQKKQSS